MTFCVGVGVGVWPTTAGGGGAAEAIITLSPATIVEGASGRKVGDLSVANGSGSYTFSITADPDNKFTIANGDELTLDNAIDYETATSHLVTIEADNGVDTPISRQFTITVTDVDDTAPTITSANSGSVAENAQLSFALTANEAVTWSITGGADAARFEISGSTLRWVSNGTKNYESPDDADTNNTYVVQVTATDGAGNATNQTITITVSDVTNPTITSSNTVSVAENATLSRALTANESVTWSIVGGADQAQFEISGSTLRWSSNGTRNYESPADADTNNAYVVTVRATSAATGETADQTITVTVTDVDEVAPTITSSASVDATDDATLSHALTANETVTWSIIGGADAAQFEISGSTLRWASNGTRDYEAPADADANNAYIVQVRATDTASNTSDQTITVTVAASGPSVVRGDIVITWNTLGGDATPGFAVDLPYGNGAPIDAEVGDHLIFEYTTNGGSSWTAYVDITITADHIAGDPLDFSGATPLTEAEWDFRARLESSDGLEISNWATEDVSLDLTAPTITSTNSASVAENSTLSKSLTANETVTWSITGGADAAEFEISGSTLRWASNGTQDYEAPADADTNNTYVVQVTATDTAGNTANQTVTVTVTDVSDSSTPSHGTVVARQENFAYGGTSYTFTNVDTEDMDYLLFNAIVTEGSVVTGISINGGAISATLVHTNTFGDNKQYMANVAGQSSVDITVTSNASINDIGLVSLPANDINSSAPTGGALGLTEGYNANPTTVTVTVPTDGFMFMGSYIGESAAPTLSNGGTLSHDPGTGRAFAGIVKTGNGSQTVGLNLATAFQYCDFVGAGYGA
jgi:ribosomal protein S11